MALRIVAHADARASGRTAAIRGINRDDAEFCETCAVCRRERIQADQSNKDTMTRLTQASPLHCVKGSISMVGL